MKKKFGFSIMPICLLALSLAFVSCNMDADESNDFEGTWRGVSNFHHYAIVITGRDVSVHRLPNANAAVTDGNRLGSGRITRFGTAGEDPIADLGEGLTGVLRLGTFGLFVYNVSHGTGFAVNGLFSR